MSELVKIGETTSGGAYKIIIENDFSKLAESLTELDTNGRRACIVTDSNVGSLYEQEVEGKQIVVIEVPRADRTIRPVYLFSATG